MNKKLVPIIVIILLLAVGAYALKSKTPNAPKFQTSNQVANEATEFANAIKSGKPTQCTMTKTTDKMEYFLKGKKMYINMSNIIENKTVLSHIINDEKYMYMWTDGTKQGSKISLLASPSNPPAQKLESETDYDKFKNDGYTINCVPSNIDDTAFIPPSDVKFVDPSEMLKGIDMSKVEELKQQYGQ